MSDVTQITDHAARALDRLASQFREKPLISAIVECCGVQAQAIEDAIWSVLVGLRIADATDAALDAIGSIVGQARDGAPDTVYRVRILSRIRASRSNGTVEDLIAICRIVFDGTVRVEPQPPARAVVHLEGAAIDETTAAVLAAVLGDAGAAGVSLWLSFSPVAPAETFALADGPIVFLQNGEAIGSSFLACSTALDAFPPSGDLVIDHGTSRVEIVTYTSKIGQTFALNAPLAIAHDIRGAVQRWPFSTTGKGLGDDADASIGGKLAGIIEA